MAVSRELIVDAALGILDSYGLADLSMRRIGDALGVQAASIYWHYANKQSLLAGVSDAILAAQAEVARGGTTSSEMARIVDLADVLAGEYGHAS